MAAAFIPISSTEYLLRDKWYRIYLNSASLAMPIFFIIAGTKTNGL